MSQTTEQPDLFDERILVLAPTGRDAALACEVLTKEEFRADSCHKMEDLCDGLVRGAGAALITQEALTMPSLDQLVNALSKQPAWSDLPLMILTTADTKNSQFTVLKALNSVGNYILLERPLGRVTLVSATRGALRARRRQYQIRDYLEALRESEERLRAALTAANMGSWRANLTTGVSTRDADLNRILGYQAVETIRPIDDRFQLVHPEDKSAAIAAWQRAIESKGVYEAEFRLVGEDGTLRWLREQGRFAPGQNGSTDFVTGVTLDITDRKRAEELLLESDRRKDEFLANMSHEIRTPMSSILGYCEILSSHLKDPDDAECVRIIRQSGNYLLEIINDILDLSKIESGGLKLNKQVISLPTVLGEVYTLMAVRANEKGLTLLLKYDGALPESIVSDRVRLRQILINLVSNAIKFTERGSVQIVGRFFPETSLLEFEVVDTGIGISREMQERVFQPFTQADASVTREYGGTGLGLAITKRLIDMMEGSIAFVTEVNRGTTFRVTIPTDTVGTTTVSMPRLLDSVEPVASNMELDCRVLVVDDRREIRHLVSQFIEEAGGRVTAVGNGLSGIQAVQQANKENQPFDIILMDIQMPELDGYEATRRLRSQGFTMPIIGLTANAMKGDREKCLQAGCHDYLSKPINRNPLVEMVARYTKKDQKPSSGATPVVGNPSLKILLVDDSEHACIAIGRLLEKAGHRVRTALNGESALGVAQDFDADVVMLDFKLPDINGYELLRRLKKIPTLQNAKFFAVSGYAREDIQEKAPAVDFDYFIMKPIDMSSLQELFLNNFRLIQ